ncbi:MAG: hypothetical protein J0M26_25820 [Planctomycetes bacterium]|nr:hypothetical protein [Planctomycetota bacterium]
MAIRWSGFRRWTTKIEAENSEKLQFIPFFGVALVYPVRSDIRDRYVLSEPLRK